MTYLPPKKWWMRLFKSIYQCQDKPLIEQYYDGVRYFDIRIAFDGYGVPEFRHGLVAFKGDVYDYFTQLNNLGCTIVRIVLERTTDDLDHELFYNLCKKLLVLYPNITFTCGEDKKTKEVIYDFNICEPVTEMYGSVRGKGLERIFPKLYAKRHNEELKDLYEDKDYLMIDFV